MRCVRRCSASSSAGDDDGEIRSAAVRDIQQAAQESRGRRNISTLPHLQVDAVYLVAIAAVDVLEPEDGRMQRDVNEVVAILRRETGDIRLHGQLRAANADDLKPLVVDLYVVANRIVGSKKRRRRALAQHGYRCRGVGFGFGEESAVHEL